VRREGALAVGAARLRVNGDARGDMPLRSRSGRTVIVVNGEVFNHRDLYGGGEGASDLAGLPDLLERCGTDALSRIRGPFALAALDLEARSLLIARDEIGIRPLFLREMGEAVLVCSEVEPLRAVVPYPARDDEAWDHILAFQFWPKDRTPWAGITPLLPGRWRRYRQGPEGMSVEEGTLAFTEGAGDVAGALDEAFALQGPRRRKGGCLLSGGLDSSAVLGGLAAAGSPPEIAVTGWFPGATPAFDERPFARAAAKELGVPILEVGITAQAYLDAWPEVLRALGGPVAGPGSVSQWILCRHLAAEGASIVYSGQGGDELFGGYERHRLLLQRDLGLPVRPAAGYEGLLDDGALDPVATLLYRGRQLLPFLEPGRRRGVERARHHLPDATPPAADRVLAYECDVLLPGLLAVDDRTIAAFGMEGRVPLLDPVVARLARGIPLGVKSPPDQPRRIFLESVGPRLPVSVRGRRDKMGFPVPLDAWLRGPWREWLRDHPSLDALPELGFGSGARRALLDGTLKGRTAWFVMSVALALEARPAALTAQA
jgi:asparagine synthase (glutamine-hydrolysing)